MATYVGYQDFSLDTNSGSGATLKLKFMGISFVMFKSSGCKESQYMEPHFKAMANETNAVTFRILNMTENRSVAPMSAKSTTILSKPLDYILYVDGFPKARHRGEITPDSVRTFLRDAINIIKNASQQPHHQPQQQHFSGQSRQPQFSGNTTPSNTNNLSKQCDPEDDTCITVPSGIIPYNMPWEADAKMGR